MRDFVGAFRGAGLRLIVFFDGGVDDAKLDEWLSRRKRDLSNCDKAPNPNPNPNPNPHPNPHPHPNLTLARC